jgi:hypothetical protein
MITYLLRFIWALVVQIGYIIFQFLFIIFAVFFYFEEIKHINKKEWTYIIHIGDVNWLDWFTFSKKGVWKSIFHWAFKIKKH